MPRPITTWSDHPALRERWLQDENGCRLRPDGTFQIKYLYLNWTSPAGSYEVYRFGDRAHVEQFLTEHYLSERICIDAIQLCCKFGSQCPHGRHFNVHRIVEILSKISVRQGDVMCDQGHHQAEAGAVCKHYRKQEKHNDKGCSKTSHMFRSDIRTSFDPAKVCPYFHFSIGNHLRRNPDFWQMANGERVVARPRHPRVSYRCDFFNLGHFPYFCLENLTLTSSSEHLDLDRRP